MDKKITIKDIIQSLRQLPKTITILSHIDNKMLVQVVILSLITGIFPIVTLLISQELINSLVLVDKEIRHIFLLLAIYITVSIASNLFDELNEYIQTLFQYKLQYGLQYMMMERCTTMELRDFECSKTYDTIEKVTAEVAYRPFQMFLSIVSIITSITTMLSSIIVILAWKPYMAIVLLVIPILSLFYYIKIGQQEFNMMWNRAKEERKMWYYNHILTHDFSYKEIKVLGIGKYLLSKYSNISRKFIKQNQGLLNKKTIFDSLYGIVIQVMSFLIIGFAIMSAYLGQILVGNVISIINAIGMVQSNSRTIMSGLYSIYSNSLYMEMVFDFLDKTKEKAKEADGKKLTALSEIELRNVDFSYDNKNNTLQKISLRFKKGTSVAIVGANGSGKSTLLKLLVGLYKPSSGEILYDGVPISDIDMSDLYEKISVLFQDFVKYELTLRENVGFGDLKNINDEKKLENVLKEIKTNFLWNGQGKYDFDMQLGNWFENGRELSQGQWQKIALARVCLKDAMCYFLDEPNAALDTVSEREIFHSFFKMAKDKIGIYISHRLSSAKMADQIVVMDKGKIAAIGKHEELIKNCLVYQELYEAENYEKGYVNHEQMCG